MLSEIVDVVLITALPMEFEAAKAALLRPQKGKPGVSNWTSVDDVANAPYLLGHYELASAGGFRVALTRPTRMGANNTGPIAATLASRLRPQCLVMCGVCAGNPGEVALGDVVLSELAYAYDEGKLEHTGFVGDHRQSPISEAWLRAAQDLEVDGLPSHGPATADDARFWLLERLHGGDDPRKHPARTRYFPQGVWSSQVLALQKEGLIERRGQTLQITDAGNDLVHQSLVYDVDPPKTLPFALKVGPIASGNVVVKDGLTWDKLKGMGVRSVVGLEMEAATIGTVARSAGIPEWMVVKGVMDHADPNKDDRFKPFAARASAEVLARFLAGRFTRSAKSGAKAHSTAKTAAAASTTGWRPRSPHDAFFDEVASAVNLHAPRFRGLFDLARQAAVNAYAAGDRAQAVAEQVRDLLGATLVEAHEKPLKKGPKILHARTSRGKPSLIAKVWNSGDEYLGHGKDDVEQGLGVFKVYRISTVLTPDLVSAYAGRVQAGRYGPSGVFTFRDRSQFAGDWTDGHPNLGYREFIGEGHTLDCDFFLGTMGSIPDHLQPRWFPQGEGVIVDASKRRVTCGTFQEGRLQIQAASFHL